MRCLTGAQEQILSIDEKDPAQCGVHICRSKAWPGTAQCSRVQCGSTRRGQAQHRGSLRVGCNEDERDTAKSDAVEYLVVKRVAAKCKEAELKCSKDVPSQCHMSAAAEEHAKTGMRSPPMAFRHPLVHVVTEETI